jgi:transposase-like protein
MGQRRTFSREFKLEAVRLVRDRGVSAAQAARDLDIHENVLRNWMRQQGADAKGSIGKRNAIRPCLSNVDAEADSAWRAQKRPNLGPGVWSPACSGWQGRRSRRLRTQSVSIGGDAAHAYAPQAAGAARRGWARR